METECDFCSEETQDCCLVKLVVQYPERWETLWEGELCASCRKKIVELIDTGQ